METWHYKDGRIDKYEVTPEDFGLGRANFEDIQGGDPQFNAGVIRDIFEGRDRGPRRDFLVLNNGFALYTVCILDDAQLVALRRMAVRLGLETLVETHSAAELRRVARLGIESEILGINNRDILRRETDDGTVSLTERLAADVPAGSLLLSESSIRGPDDARRARDAGADAVLVGTAILLAEDPAGAIDDLVAVGWR